MNLSDCYRLLELRADASFEEVKTSYRRLVRRYHPDVNPDRPAWAKDKFIEVTEAYQFLLKTLSTVSPASVSRSPQSSYSPSTSTSVKTNVRVKPKSRPSQSQVRLDPNLSDIDKKLKRHIYQQLQAFLKTQRFPRAIALVEGLAQRLPQDPEIKQWQAIAYQRWARHLVNQQQYDKARIYLKKALRVDPHNRSLWSEIRRDFDRLEQLRLRRRI